MEIKQILKWECLCWKLILCILLYGSEIWLEESDGKITNQVVVTIETKRRKTRIITGKRAVKYKRKMKARLTTKF